MYRALDLARQAGAAGEVPVGCVIAGPDGSVIGTGRNRREGEHSALAHAEVEAIGWACRALGTWRLEGCALYVTLEPCPMCAGAILNARIPAVFFGTAEERSGCCGSVLNLFAENFGFRPKVYGGLLEEDCRAVLAAFFQNLRTPPPA